LDLFSDMKGTASRPSVGQIRGFNGRDPGKRPVSQSCYKLDFDATLRRVAQARDAFRLPPAQSRAGMAGGVARSVMSEFPDVEHAFRARGLDPLVVVRYLDVGLVVAAAPFVILLGAPVVGYVVAAVAWIVQRFAAVAIERRAARQSDYRAVLGLNMASLFVRAWLIGLTILAVGLIAEREDGLTAGITVLVAFTVYFATSLILRPLERKPPRA
jgi:hypothetical protein